MNLLCMDIVKSPRSPAGTPHVSPKQLYYLTSIHVSYGMSKALPLTIGWGNPNPNPHGRGRPNSALRCLSVVLHPTHI